VRRHPHRLVHDHDVGVVVEDHQLGDVHLGHRTGRHHVGDEHLHELT